MATNEQASKSAKSKKRQRAAPHERASGETRAMNGGLSGMQALALWELVLLGDGKSASQRSVDLEPADVERLAGAGMITIASGPRKKDPAWGAKMYLTDQAWAWASGPGLLEACLALSKAAVPLFNKLLRMLGAYLLSQELALDHVLRPRRREPEQAADDQAARANARASQENAEPPPDAGSSEALGPRIRDAYLRVTHGAWNKYVRLADLRAQLHGEPVESIDAALRAMQQQGGAVLYPIDDPQRIRPEDNAAALRVAGERRDLLCIKG